jgi:ABC-type dipeptide/oligopeptide/nickel transport system permease subunit
LIIQDKFFKKFRSNKLASLGSMVLMLIVFFAVFGYGIVPDHSRTVNEQNLSLKYLKPITTVYFIQNDPNLERRSISDFFFGSKEFDSKQPIESVFTRKDSFYYKEYKSSYWQSKPISQKISPQTYLLGADATWSRYF